MDVGRLMAKKSLREKKNRGFPGGDFKLDFEGCVEFGIKVRTQTNGRRQDP